jgi:hypothetical protein
VTYTVVPAPFVALPGTAPIPIVAVAFPFPPATPVTAGLGTPAPTHSVTNGNVLEKMFASTPTSLSGGGNNGICSPILASADTVIFAETRTRGPRAARPVVVWFAPGAVLFAPQFAATLVESFASNLGKFSVTAASAVSLSRKSKPTVTTGLKARPSAMSMFVMLTLKGRRVRAESWKPVMLDLRMLVRSRRI